MHRKYSKYVTVMLLLIGCVFLICPYVFGKKVSVGVSSSGYTNRSVSNNYFTYYQGKKYSVIPTVIPYNELDGDMHPGHQWGGAVFMDGLNMLHICTILVLVLWWLASYLRSKRRHDYDPQKVMKAFKKPNK